MQIVDSKMVSELDSTEVYTEQTLECVNPDCASKGTKVKIKNKVN
jgi:hypothetical protein